MANKNIINNIDQTIKAFKDTDHMEKVIIKGSLLHNRDLMISKEKSVIGSFTQKIKNEQVNITKQDKSEDRSR